MQYNVNGVDITKRITEEQLRELTFRLGKFLDTYWKNVKMTDEEQLQIFRQLTIIHHYFNSRQYNELFDNPNIVMTELDMESYT